MPNGGNTSETENQPKTKPCKCYCLLNWIQGTASDTPSGPIVTTTSFLGWVETETETGIVLQDANVRTKNYVCNTTTEIPPSSDQVYNRIPKNKYTKKRSRLLGFNVTVSTPFGPWLPYVTNVTIAWKPWGTWRRIDDADHTPQKSLALIGLTPYCSDKGLSCP